MKLRSNSIHKNLGRQQPKTKMDKHSCKEDRTKSYQCAGIHDHRKEVAPNGQETKQLVFFRNQQSTEILVEEG